MDKFEDVTTWNIYYNHCYDIRDISVKHNCDMNTATSIWEHEYFKGNITPTALHQRKRWMAFMSYIVSYNATRSNYTLASIF